MKNNIITIVLIGAFLTISTYGKAQVTNWGSLAEDQRHILQLNVGLNYGTIVGIGYGYKLNAFVPIVLNMEYSFPTGKSI